MSPLVFDKDFSLNNLHPLNGILSLFKSDLDTDTSVV